MSQEELRKLIRVSLASVIKWEQGKHEPTAIAKVKIEDLFKEKNMKVEDK